METPPPPPDVPCHRLPDGLPCLTVGPGTSHDTPHTPGIPFYIVLQNLWDGDVALQPTPGTTQYLPPPSHSFHGIPARWGQPRQFPNFLNMALLPHHDQAPATHHWEPREVGTGTIACPWRHSGDLTLVCPDGFRDFAALLPACAVPQDLPPLCR